MHITVRVSSVDEISQAPTLPQLLAEYAAESAIAGLGAANPQFDTYRQLEASGLLHMAGAFDGDDLVGFLLVLVNELPHYGKRVAVVESVFLSNSARVSRAGLNLIREAQVIAKRTGAVGLLLSAPSNGVLDYLLPSLGFSLTNRVFFRSTQ